MPAATYEHTCRECGARYRTTCAVRSLCAQCLPPDETESGPAYVEDPMPGTVAYRRWIAQEKGHDDY